MVAIGVGMVLVGYSIGLWAWMLLRGYNVTLGALFSPNGLAPSKAPAKKTA